MTQGIWKALLYTLLIYSPPVEALVQAIEQAALSASSQPTAPQIVCHFSLPDTEGQSHTAEEWRQTRAVVLFFIAAECPISNRYAPEINRLVADFASQHVTFYAVHSDPALSAAEARRHAADFGYKLTVLLDPAQVLARQTGVELTPTAVILSPPGQVLYRGRIDNRYLDYGRYRDINLKADLRQALQSVLDGKPIEEPITKSIGCALPPPAKEGSHHEHPPR